MAKSEAQIIEVYAAHGDAGGTGLPGPIVGIFRSHTAATEAAKGRGWYGGDGAVLRQLAIELSDGRVFLLVSAEPVELNTMQASYDERLRAQAVAKLSPEERRVLGVSKEARR